MRTHEARIVSALILIPALIATISAAGGLSGFTETAQAQAGSGQPKGDQAPAKTEVGEKQASKTDPASQAAALKAPDFTVKDLKGQTIHLAELLAKGPVYLNFWTSWCSPCKREMPELDRIHRTYRDRGFTVLAIAQDDTRTVGKVKPYIDSNKFQFLAATDPTKSIGNSYSVRQYPTSYLIRQDGTVAYFAQAYLPGDEKKIERLVLELLGMETGEQSPGSTR